jgi:transposase
MVLYARKLTKAEEGQLQLWSSGDDPTMKHRAEIILLSSQGYRIPEIGSLARSHPANLRKWIHRFNEQGCDGLRTRHAAGSRLRFTTQQRTQIVQLAQARPRELGLNFTRWTLHRLAQQAASRGIVERISHECVRQILKEAARDYRQSARIYR